MFGTMTEFRPKPGQEAAMHAWFAGESAERSAKIEGFLCQYILEPATPGNDWIAFIVFDSEANYRSNAADLAQHQSYLALLDLVVAPPTWHDGEIRLAEPSSVAL